MATLIKILLVVIIAALYFTSREQPKEAVEDFNPVPEQNQEGKPTVNVRSGVTVFGVTAEQIESEFEEINKFVLEQLEADTLRIANPFRKEDE